VTLLDPPLTYPRRSARATAVPRVTVVDVRDYGVALDASVDAAPGINQAITDAFSVGGGKVHIPYGTYLVAASVVLKPGVIVAGNGVNHGYVAGSPARTAAKLQAAGGMTGYMVDTDTAGISGAAFAGVDVRGNGSTGGVRLRNASWCSVKAVHVDNMGDEGFITASNTVACVFEDLLTTNCLLTRTRAAVAGALDLDGTDHYVSRGEFSTSLTGVTDANLRVAAAVVRGTNNFVATSVGEISDTGWYVSGGSNRFVGVRADRNWGHGFVIPGGNNSLSACTALDNGQSGSNTYDGFSISGLGNQLAACSSANAAASLHRYGYNDQVNNADPSARTRYEACAAGNWLTAPFNTQGFLGSAPSMPASPVRPASGTTVIDVANTSFVVLSAYSSATTVTGFSHPVTGQSVKLLGNSNVTMQNNSTIVTNTGADKTLATDRVYEFTYYNGKWFESA
jgi:hypothetical protein